mgnify:CR=1 FL=1
MELSKDKASNIGIIVCGDFNDVPNSLTTKEYLSHKELKLKSAFPNEPYTLFQMYGENEYVIKNQVEYTPEKIYYSLLLGRELMNVWRIHNNLAFSTNSSGVMAILQDKTHSASVTSLYSERRIPESLFLSELRVNNPILEV